jgi:hypothetical protein
MVERMSKIEIGLGSLHINASAIRVVLRSNVKRLGRVIS